MNEAQEPVVAAPPAPIEAPVEPIAEAGRGKGRVGVAIIGLGRAGHFHLTSIAGCPETAELKWVVDVDLDKAQHIAAEKGCKGTNSIEDVLVDPMVDALVIASTTNTHFEYCKMGLDSGKAVFTEKPISHKTEQLEKIIDMAVEKRLPFMVGYQRRVDRNFRELERQINAGAVGGIRMIKCCSRDNPLPPMPYLAVSGGIFYDMLTHDFDMIHFLSGEIPTEVYTVAYCYNDEIRAMDDVDTVMVTLKFASGLIATVDCSRTAPYGYDQRVEVFGEKGMATAENEKTSTVIVASSEGFVHPKTCHSFPQRYKECYTQEFAEFVAMVKAWECEPENTIRRHVELERVTAAAELSHRTGRAIQLCEVDKLRHLMPH
mmetsp:Transcript_35819/g.93773  ORF Transcript_35819/g.93773 Transcript_35819/m.93773 type:complete len:374 (+) Transcript_35819:32-1153(+)